MCHLLFPQVLSGGLLYIKHPVWYQECQLNLSTREYFRSSKNVFPTKYSLFAFLLPL